MLFKEWNRLLVSFTEQNKQKWNELDAAQGDGDLGITMVLGARALNESAQHSGSIREWFLTGGKSLRKAAPSTMGILVASALIAASKEIPDGKSSITPEEWIHVQKTMISEIQNRGGAKPGDKTVLDAFVPAAEAFAGAIDQGKTAGEALARAEQSAKKAAESTADLIAKTGRSSWLGERSRGMMDGGAWVCCQIYGFLKECTGKT